MDELQESKSKQQDIEKWYTSLTCETPVTKYLALALLVSLPFLGFWVGMRYGDVEYVTDTEAVGDKLDRKITSQVEKSTPEEYILSHNACNIDTDCVIVRKAFGCCSDGNSMNKNMLPEYLELFSDEILEEKIYCEQEYEKGLSCAAQRYTTQGYEPACINHVCVITDV